MTVGEVLGGILSFEGTLESYYASIRDEAELADLRILVYFLGRSRRKMQSIIEEYGDEVTSRIKVIDVQGNPAKLLKDAFEASFKAPDKVTGEDLVEFANRMDVLCIDCYKGIIQSLEDEEAIGLFDKFIDCKQAERTMLQKMPAADS